MATQINTIVDAFDRLPIAAVNSNVPYGVQAHPDEAELRRQVRGSFIQNEDQRSPEINYPGIDVGSLTAQLRMIEGLLNDIDDAPEGTPETAQNTLYDTLLQKHDEILRHLAVARAIGKTASPWFEGRSHAELIEYAARGSIEIFGVPDVNTFRFLLGLQRDLAASQLRSSDQNVVDAATAFLAATSHVERSERDKPVELSPEYLEVLRNDMYAVFPGLEAFVNMDVSYPLSSRDVLPIVSQALAVVGLDKKGYRPRYTNGGALEENCLARTVDIGVNRGDFDGAPGNDPVCTSFHEAIHLLRFQNAREQPNPEHRIRTRANNNMDEGLPVVLEQIMRCENQTRGLAYLMAIGLYMGLDRSENDGSEADRDFRDVYNLTRWMRIMNGAQDIAAANRASYDTVLRVSRGGALDTRDVLYFNADQHVKKWLLSIKDLPPEERQEHLRWVLSGLFDPMNPHDKHFSNISIVRYDE